MSNILPGKRESRTKHRATFLIVRRVVPIPVLEGIIRVVARVIDGELDGEGYVTTDLEDCPTAQSVP
jgi:hypothetical protein